MIFIGEHAAAKLLSMQPLKMFHIPAGSID